MTIGVTWINFKNNVMLKKLQKEANIMIFKF